MINCFVESIKLANALSVLSATVTRNKEQRVCLAMENNV